MKIGISTFVTGYAIQPAVLAQRVEALGFESFWVPEHPIIPVHTTTRFPGSADGIIPDHYSKWLDPFVTLASAAAVTKTIKLGTGICLVPERNPLHLAEEVASLDHCSERRFLLGIGAGWLREETEIFGANFERSWSWTRECILAMKELMTSAGDPVGARLAPLVAGPAPSEHAPGADRLGGVCPARDAPAGGRAGGWEPLDRRERRGGGHGSSGPGSG